MQRAQALAAHAPFIEEIFTLYFHALIKIFTLYFRGDFRALSRSFSRGLAQAREAPHGSTVYMRLSVGAAFLFVARGDKSIRGTAFVCADDGSAGGASGGAKSCVSLDKANSRSWQGGFQLSVTVASYQPFERVTIEFAAPGEQGVR